MIELEIQGLSADREGLLIDVGRLVMAHGFTLQRQRLVQDAHGILLTMVVRGPARGEKRLKTALDTYERFISVQMMAWVAGEARPHFAASLPRAPCAPPPTPAMPSITEPARTHTPIETTTPVADELAKSASAATPTPGQVAPDEPDFDFIQPTPRPPAPTLEVIAPFVEVIPLEPDEAAVENALRVLEHDYCNIIPQLLALQASVAEGARVSSLALAGRRTGHWVFQNDYLLDDGLALGEAIERLGVPSLMAFTEVDLQGSQLHIRDSPLCSKNGASGCSFFGGFLEGLLEPAIAPGTLSIFPVCCRSYGADACVLALSD